MKYLPQIELFIIKKLLLEVEEKPKEYLLADFNKHGAKVIIDCLLRLAEENFLTLSSIKIKYNFFETVFSDFIDVDFNERGRPAYVGVNYEKIKDCDYVGLGKKTFERYDKECCPEGNILEPDLDLEVDTEELKYIVKNSSHFPTSYGNSLFENLTFSICQSKKQKEKLEEYLNGYLEKFRNDDLERQSAIDYYKYAKQKEMLNRTITEIGINYPIKNLWLKESDVNLHGNPAIAIINDHTEHFNFLETLFCLEQESNKGKGIKIEELDKEKGVRITDYSEKQIDAKAYAEEMKRQFTELNERRTELEELEERIYSRVRKELDIPIHYFKSHEEIIKTISKQLAPLKDVLEKVGRAQQTVKISLTPALQNLAPSLKQLEEQIKNFNELYKTPDHSLSETIISPDLIRVQQEAEMISELREVRKLIEKSTINKNEPIPIKGELKIEGLKEGLEAIAKTKKEEGKNKFPYKLPSGTKWENFTIKFEDDENVFIQVKQFKHNADYKEMGMVGRGKNPSPSEAWTFMRVLARVNGELTIKDVQARNKYKKQKELLAKALQNYFSLDYDPFYPYHSSIEKSGNSYKIKITLIPPDKKEKVDTNKDDNDDLGIKEYLDEQTPQV